MVVDIGCFDPFAIYQRKQEFLIVEDSLDNTPKIVATESSFFQKRDKAEDLKVVNTFFTALQAIRKGADISPEKKRRLIQTADLYLKTMAKKYETTLQKGWCKCKSNQLMHAIERLDRYVTAEKFPYLQATKVLDSHAVASLYTTELAKESLFSWIQLKKHRALKSKEENSDLTFIARQSDNVIPSAYAAESFFHFPEEVDFIKDLYLHRYISRFNGTIEIDTTTKRHKIKHEGVMKPLAAILPHMNYGTMYSYDSEKGVVAKSSTEWTFLAPFRKRKQGKNKDDYKFVIKTITKNQDIHSWIELKTPDDVYNIGYFPHHEESLDNLARFKTVRAQIHTPDIKELSGNDADIKKTAIAITKEQFISLKEYIEYRQRDVKTKAYDQISNNCCSFVCAVAAKIGIFIDAKENLLSLGLGWHVSFGFAQDSIIGKIFRAIISPLSYIRNLAMYYRGASNSNNEYKDHGISSDIFEFKKFSDIFNARKGLIDHPSRIRQWQQAVEREREKAKNKIMKDKYFMLLSKEKQNLELKKASLAPPLNIILDPTELIF